MTKVTKHIPFSETGSLTDDTDETLNTVRSSCLHGRRELTVLTGSLAELQERAEALDNTHGDVVGSVTRAVKEQLQSAWRDCSSQFEDRWVDDITTNAIDLRYASSSLPPSALVEAVRTIKANILELRAHHTLGEENRKYIQFAEALLRDLEQGTPAQPISKRRVRQSDKLVSVDFNPTKQVSKDPQVAMVLCEVTHLFVLEKVSQAMALLETLPECERREIDTIAGSLGGSKEALYEADEEAFLSASMAYARATLARGNVYAGNDAGIPDEDEVLVLFGDDPSFQDT